MLKPKHSKKFKQDLKKFVHQKAIMEGLRDVLICLLNQKPLDEKYCDHPLSGNWKGHRECHVRPDILLIYKNDTDRMILFLERFNSHSELFK